MQGPAQTSLPTFQPTDTLRAELQARRDRQLRRGAGTSWASFQPSPCISWPLPECLASQPRSQPLLTQTLAKTVSVLRCAAAVCTGYVTEMVQGPAETERAASLYWVGLGC